MNEPFILIELDFDSAVEAVKNYNADMPAHAQAPKLTSKNWPKFKKLLHVQIKGTYWVEDFQRYLDRVMFDGRYELEREDK